MGEHAILSYCVFTKQREAMTIYIQDSGLQIL